MSDMSTMELPQDEVYDISSLGEGIRTTGSRTVELTKEFAEGFLEHAEFLGERQLMEGHVIFLARQMEAGSFRWEQVCLILAELEGRTYRINGQHTCWARIHADLAKDVRTPVKLLKYVVATDHDLRQLYATTDRGKARTRGNVIVSYLSGTEEFPEFNKSILKALASGMSYWKWGPSENANRRNVHTADDTAYLLLTENHKVATQVGNLIKLSKPGEFKHLRRAPVIGAMFATFNKAPTIAHDFWVVIRDGIGVAGKDDPRYTLRQYLLAANLSTHSGDSDKLVNSEEMYRACLTCWNRFRANSPLKVIKSVAERPEPR
jgi:hypothetical protein